MDQMMHQRDHDRRPKMTLFENVTEIIVKVFFLIFTSIQ